MARPGKNGGVNLSYNELKTLVEGLDVSRNDTVSRLGVPLEGHLDFLVYDLARTTGIQYWGVGKPFENSGNSSHFHYDSRGRFEEKDRIGVSFYPNLKQETVTPTSSEDEQKQKYAGLKLKPTIVAKIHGGDVISHKIDPLELPGSELDKLLKHSLLKVKDENTGQSRDLIASDLKLAQGTATNGKPWQGLYLDHRLEYDKDSVAAIEKEHGKDTLQARIENYAQRYSNNLDFSKVKSRDFQKQFAAGMDAALVQQAVYEQAHPREQGKNRFLIRQSNYLDRATKDTMTYGIGNLKNVWEDLYRKGSILLASELNENEPLGKFFIDTMKKGYEESGKNLDSRQALHNLKENSATFLIYQKIDGNNEVQKVVQRVGAIKSPNMVSEADHKDKKFLSGGGGFDAHYIEVLGSIDPNADVKPPQNIFILEGIKTAVDFAAALDLKQDTDNHNTHVVLSAGSADNVVLLSESMAKLHEDAMIAVVADNDLANSLQDTHHSENTGVVTAIKAVNAVRQARQSLGVHPNSTYLIPPAIGRRNTDVADLREHYMKSVGEKIVESLNNINAAQEYKGVNVDEQMQDRAKAYAGKVFTGMFGQTIANTVNNGLQAARERGEVIHAPTFQPAPLEPIATIGLVKPLPQTFGKPRSQANPENAALKARIQGNAVTLMENASEFIKDTNQSMWSHLGFRQRYDKGELVELKQTRSSERVANVAALMVDTLVPDHPLHDVVNEALVNAYLNSDQKNPIDMANTSYAKVAWGWQQLGKALQKSNANGSQRSLFQSSLASLAISAFSSSRDQANEAWTHYSNLKDPIKKNDYAAINPSTTLLTMAQLISKDIADHSITAERGGLGRVRVEDRVYQGIVEGMNRELDSVDSKTLQYSGYVHEPLEAMGAAFEFSKHYVSALKTADILGYEYRGAKEGLSAEEKTARYEKSHSYTKFAELVQDKVFSGANKGDPTEFWQKVEAMHPQVLDDLEDLKELGDRFGLDFADESASSNLYKVNSSPFVPQQLPTAMAQSMTLLSKHISDLEIFKRDMSTLTVTSAANSTLDANQQQPHLETKAGVKPAPEDSYTPSP